MTTQAHAAVWSVLASLIAAGLAWTAHDLLAARTTRATLENTLVSHERRLSTTEKTVRSLEALNERATATHEHIREILRQSQRRMERMEDRIRVRR